MKKNELAKIYRRYTEEIKFYENLHFIALEKRLYENDEKLQAIYKKEANRYLMKIKMLNVRLELFKRIARLIKH